MAFVYRVRVDCSDVGKRVTVRRRTPDGKSTDAVGVLVACDEETFVVQDKRGSSVTIARADVLAAKVVG